MSVNFTVIKKNQILAGAVTRIGIFNSFDSSFNFLIIIDIMSPLPMM